MPEQQNIEYKQSWHEDYLKDYQPEEKDPNNHMDMEYIAVKICYEYDKDYKNPSQMNLSRFPDFYGYGPSNGINSTWALDFSPLHTLKHYPFKIENKIQIYKMGDKTNKFKCTELLNSESYEDVSVYDVLRAIFFEITFCGSPSSRDDKKQDIDDSIANLKESIENGDYSCLKKFDLGDLGDLDIEDTINDCFDSAMIDEEETEE